MANILDLPAASTPATSKPLAASRQKDTGGSGPEFATKLSEADAAKDTEDTPDQLGVATGIAPDQIDAQAAAPDTAEDISAVAGSGESAEATADELKEGVTVSDETAETDDAATAPGTVAIASPPETGAQTDASAASPEAADSETLADADTDADADSSVTKTADTATTTTSENAAIAQTATNQTQDTRTQQTAKTGMAVTETRAPVPSKQANRDTGTVLAADDLAAGADKKADASIAAPVTPVSQDAPIMQAQHAPAPGPAAATVASAPAPAAAAAQLPMVPVAPTEIANVLSRSLASGDDGPDRVVVQLDPPELGRVSIDFKFDAQGLQTVTVTGENPEALRRMREMHSELISVLQQHGLSGQDLNFGQQQQSQQHADQQIIFNQFKSVISAGDSTAGPWPVMTAIPAAAQVRSSDALDIKV